MRPAVITFSLQFTIQGLIHSWRQARYIPLIRHGMKAHLRLVRAAHLKCMYKDLSTYINCSLRP